MGMIDAGVLIATFVASFVVGGNVGVLIAICTMPRVVVEDHWQVYRIWFWQIARYEREGFSISWGYTTGSFWLWLTLPAQIAGEWIRPSATRIVGEAA